MWHPFVCLAVAITFVKVATPAPPPAPPFARPPLPLDALLCCAAATCYCRRTTPMPPPPLPPPQDALLGCFTSYFAWLKDYAGQLRTAEEEALAWQAELDAQAQLARQDPELDPDQDLDPEHPGSPSRPAQVSPSPSTADLRLQSQPATATTASDGRCSRSSSSARAATAGPLASSLSGPRGREGSLGGGGSVVRNRLIPMLMGRYQHLLEGGCVGGTERAISACWRWGEGG